MTIKSWPVEQVVEGCLDDLLKGFSETGFGGCLEGEV